MNATQLRKLGFTEAADAADAQNWQGDKARVLVEHQRKSPLDADLSRRIVEVMDKHDSIRDGWLSDAERAEVMAQATQDATALADEMLAKFTKNQDGRGAGCAGNDSETCEAGGWG